MNCTFLEYIKLKGIDYSLLRDRVPLIEVIHVLIIDYCPLFLFLLFSLFDFIIHLTHGIRDRGFLVLQLVNDVDLISPCHVGMIEPGWLSLDNLTIVKVHHNSCLRL